jgi:Na+/H+ antiporter NhaD/arsenite permease-like protein
MNAWLNSIPRLGRAGEWSLNFSYSDVLKNLWPVAIICVLSLLCTVLWLFAVRAHLPPKGHTAPRCRGAHIAVAKADETG